MPVHAARRRSDVAVVMLAKVGSQNAGTDVVGGASDWRLPPAATSATPTALCVVAAVAVTTLAAAIAAVQGVGVEGPPRCLLNHRLKSLNEWATAIPKRMEVSRLVEGGLAASCL